MNAAKTAAGACLAGMLLPLLLVAQRARASDMIGEKACMLRQVIEHLNLTEQQRPVIASLDREFQKDHAALRAQMLGQRRELLNLIAAPKPNEARITARAAEISRMQTALDQRVIRHLLTLKRHLDAGQQRKLFAAVGTALRYGAGGTGLCGHRGGAGVVP